MKTEGGCFCGAIRYEADGEPILKGQCHCRQCQYFAGGGPNLFIAMPTSGFTYTKGKPKTYARENAPVLSVTREFCETCGVHLVTRPDPLPDILFVKVGTLDNPADFGGPKIATFTSDKQAFHSVAEGVAAFDKLPPL